MNLSDLLELARQIDRTYSEACRPLCEQFGLARTDFDILLFLANHPDLYTAKDISRCRNLKPNVVSVHVEQLAKEGYLARTEIPHDRRKVRLTCTPKAAPVTEAGQKMQKRYHEALVSGLGEEELETFQHCFAVMRENAGQLLQEKTEKRRESL